jgi:hypothetical protein
MRELPPDRSAEFRASGTTHKTEEEGTKRAKYERQSATLLHLAHRIPSEGAFASCYGTCLRKCRNRNLARRTCGNEELQ